MSSYERVDADIKQLRRKLKKLDGDKDVQGGGPRSPIPTHRPVIGRALRSPRHDNDTFPKKQSQQQQQQQQQQQSQQHQQQQIRTSLDMFGHLSSSTRNLGQRKSSIGASRVAVNESNMQHLSTTMQGQPDEPIPDQPDRHDYKNSCEIPATSNAIRITRRSISMASTDGNASVGGIFGGSEAEISHDTSSDNYSDEEQDFHRITGRYTHRNLGRRRVDDDEDDPFVGQLNRQDMNGISQFGLMNEAFGFLKTGTGTEDTEAPLKNRSDSYDAKKGSDDDLRQRSTGTDDSTNTRRQRFRLPRRRESYRNIRTVSMQPQVARPDYATSSDVDSDKEDNNDMGGVSYVPIRYNSSQDVDETKIVQSEDVRNVSEDIPMDQTELEHNQDEQPIGEIREENQGTLVKLQQGSTVLSIKRKDLSFSSSHRRNSNRNGRSLSTGKVRRSSYGHLMPLAIAPNGSAAILESTQVLDAPQGFVSAVTDYDDQDDYFRDDDFADDRLTAFELLCAPSFTQFALLEIQPPQLLLVENEYLFSDEGPNHLDAFLLNQDLDFGDHFTSDSNRPIDPTSVSSFCFPGGLRVRYIPRAGFVGARRMGWIGPTGDTCHVLVFTNSDGATDHGVAVTIQWEMSLKKSERQVLSRAIFNRRRRRKASRKIQKWWRDKEQDRVIREALELSGLDDHLLEDIKAELGPGELKILRKAFKRTDDRHSSQRLHEDRASTGQGSRRQLRKRGITKAHSSSSDSSLMQVVELTRAALKRSQGSSLAPQDEATKVSIASDDSPDQEEMSKSRRGFGMLKNLSPRPNTKFSMRSVFSSRSIPSLQSLSPTPRPKKVIVKKPSEQVIEQALESYTTMKDNDRLGSMCIVEKCYTLIGCQPDEHALLLGPLQQLVNSERTEILEFRRLRAENSSRKKSNEKKANDVDDERRLELELKNRRQVIIKTMREKLRLTMRQALITYPRSQLEHITGKIHYFETLVPQIPDCDAIKVPLPLPRVGKEWALAQFLLDVGPDSLMLCLKLLLLERSILILGESLQDVTMYACALIELLKPFEWSNAFMPVLPRKMLDFVNCPVPFVAGVAVRNIKEIERDPRIVEAMSHGMSLLNLKSNTLQITSEKGINKMISLDPYLREKLFMLRARLLQYHKEDPHSSLRSFDGFVRYGLSRRESLTLVSVCRVLEQHFSQFCADLAVNDKAWQRYGTVDVETNEFTFNPEWFLNHIRADHAFQEAFVQTQLFSGYVHEKREDRIEMHEIMEGELGCFIADWVYRKWTAKQKKPTS